MSTLFSHQFQIGDAVTFHSVHGQFPINGKRAKIIEITKVPVGGIVDTPHGTTDTVAFPHGVAICLKWDEDQRLTWCRVDEVTRV